jgi:GT2 family glycosyltransferase
MNKPKFSIVMAHYNRFDLLLKTLNSIFNIHQYKDIDVVVVDDASSNLKSKEDIFNFPVKYIQLPSNKWYCNPVIVYNVGIEYAESDIIVIQNPECYHFDNLYDEIVSVNDDQLKSFSCYSIDANTKIEDLKKNEFQNRSASFDGDLGWYTHSQFNPRPYHFCSAINRNSLYKINNFSREYAYGCAYDDDDFVSKCRRLNFKIEIVDSHSVIHQYHYSDTSIDNWKIGDKINLNRNIFMTKFS